MSSSCYASPCISMFVKNSLTEHISVDLVWVEQSGHNPPFEEPQKFNSILMVEVLRLAMEGCSQ